MNDVKTAENKQVCSNVLLCVELENGKYTVKQDKDGKFYALRHGEEWRDLCGDNLILFLAYEVDALREKVNAVKNCLVCAGIGDPMEVCENTLEILDT